MMIISRKILVPFAILLGLTGAFGLIAIALGEWVVLPQAVALTFTILLGLAAAVLFFCNPGPAMRALTGVMRDMADGACARKLPGLQRKDEIGEMARALLVLQKKDRERATSERASRRLAMAVEHAVDMILIMTCNGRIEYVNPQFETVMGIPSEKIVGQNIGDLPSLEDPETEQLIAEAFETGEPWTGIIRHKIKANSYRSGEATISPVRDSQGQVTHYVWVIRDLSEREQLEEQLRQAQKLESIGQLAAGIAHEINTPTQFVGDNTRFIEESFANISNLIDTLEKLACNDDVMVPGKDIRAALEMADVDYLRTEVPLSIAQTLEGVERVTTIVRAMKEFSHPSQTLTPSLINKAIESTITVTQSEWKYIARIETDFDPKLPPVSCVLAEINQVILSIIINAAHAIADAHAQETGSPGLIRISTRSLDKHAEIRISDTGTGMSKEVRSKVFDSFFTTKEVGKGTGQGLSIAYNVIVNRHGGELEVESTPGKGTCFIIRLPFDPETAVA